MASERPPKTTKNSPESSEIPYLTNAWVREDADGHYYLFIRARDQSVMLNLTALNPSIDEQIKNEINPERQQSFIKAVLAAWLAEQKSPSGKSKKPEEPESEFPDLINT